MKSLKTSQNLAEKVLEVCSHDHVIGYSISQLQSFFPERLEKVKQELNKLGELDNGQNNTNQTE